MNNPDVLGKFLYEIQHFSLLEIIGVLTSLVYIYLAGKQKRSCFIYGLISSAIYIYICLTHKLYFDTFINIYYVIMSVVGWWAWAKKDNQEMTPILKLKQSQFIYILLGGIVITLLLGYIAHSNTDASLPYVDGFTTVFALIATYMVVKKYIENWLIWIVVDGISIGLYFYKSLIFTSFLFLIYTIIAVKGYSQWKKQLILK